MRYVTLLEALRLNMERGYLAVAALRLVRWYVVLANDEVTRSLGTADASLRLTRNIGGTLSFLSCALEVFHINYD